MALESRAERPHPSTTERPQRPAGRPRLPAAGRPRLPAAGRPHQPAAGRPHQPPPSRSRASAHRPQAGCPGSVVYRNRPDPAHGGPAAVFPSDRLALGARNRPPRPVRAHPRCRGIAPHGKRRGGLGGAALAVRLALRQTKPVVCARLSPPPQRRRAEASALWGACTISVIAVGSYPQWAMQLSQRGSWPRP
jgi:hypothetical protein